MWRARGGAAKRRKKGDARARREGEKEDCRSVAKGACGGEVWRRAERDAREGRRVAL